MVLQRFSFTTGWSQNSTATQSMGKSRRHWADLHCPRTATPLLYRNTSWPGVGVAGCNRPGVAPIALAMVSSPFSMASKPGGSSRLSGNFLKMAAVRSRFPRQWPPGFIVGPSPRGATYRPSEPNSPARGSGQDLLRLSGTTRSGFGKLSETIMVCGKTVIEDAVDQANEVHGFELAEAVCCPQFIMQN